ncbi:hypothetical protein FJ471_09150 [Mesorhizobium sp. B2-7-1]|nr:hypothetical protein FJ471_09150 [Mesorhizobium sp. B2-7-1]
MANEVPTNKARQGRTGTHVLYILIGGLLLAGVAWGIAELYGEQAKSPSTQQPSQNSTAPASDTSSDPAMSKTDTVNGQPADQSTQVDRNPTPQSSTGGDQPRTPPSPPASP